MEINTKDWIERTKNSLSSWKSHRGVQAIAVVALVALLSTAFYYKYYATNSLEGMSSSAAQSKLRKAGQNRVKGSNDQKAKYIVVLQNTSACKKKRGKLPTDVSTHSNLLQSEYGGKKVIEFRKALLGYVSELSYAQAAKLSQDPCVKYVEEDTIVKLDQTQTDPPWGLDRIDQRKLPLNSTYTYDSGSIGAGANVYIIDSGILPTHEDFGGRASVAFDAMADGKDGIDCNSHGTHVASTIGGNKSGVAKGARLYGIRVFDCQGYATATSILEGVDWVTVNRVHPAVVNMSLGGPKSQATDDAVINSINSGVSYVVAAGNNGAAACLYSPANVEPAITVGSSGILDFRSTFSNYGSCVDIYAPGEEIMAATIGGNSNYTKKSGTSMASPHVAGIAAIIRGKNPGLSPSSVASQVKSLATIGFLSNLPSGSENLLSYSQTVNPEPSPPPPTSANCLNVKPALSVTPTNVMGAPGVPVTYSVTLKNMETAECGSKSYLLSVLNLPSGWTSTPNEITEILAPGAQVTKFITIKPSTQASAKKYDLTLEATLIVQPSIFTFAQFSYTVTIPGKISGIVSTPAGTGLRNAIVTLTNSGGITQTAPTSSLGYYQFDNLSYGTYKVSVNSRRYRFESQNISVSGDMSNVNFIGLE